MSDIERITEQRDALLGRVSELETTEAVYKEALEGVWALVKEAKSAERFSIGLGPVETIVREALGVEQGLHAV